VADGRAMLDAWIKRVDKLGPAVMKAAPPKVADALERNLEAQIQRGVGPDGKPWKLTADGRVPLAGAAEALSVRAVGIDVVARLDGPEALHNDGRVRGHIKRQILPSRELSSPLVAAIQEVCEQTFDTAVTGGAR
jgi:hypothetical protein